MAGSIHGVKRLECEERNAAQVRLNSFFFRLRILNVKNLLQKFHDGVVQNTVEKRIETLRNEMRGISAFIVTSFDEHQTVQFDDTEGRLEFISGYSGPVGDAVVIKCPLIL